MESNFGKDLAEAQQDFVEQFDPNSKTFHNGDPTPVPVGGERVPESMPTMYDQEYIKKSQETENINYGPEYDKCVEMRTLFQDLKKALNLICPPLEGVLRAQALESDEAKKQKQIDGEMAKVEKATKEVEKFIETLKQTSYAEKYVEGLQNVCKDAFKKFASKEEYTDYAFLVKKFTSMCFSEAADLLNKMKKIKADFNKAPK